MSTTAPWEGPTATIDRAALKTALTGLRFVGFSDGRDPVWFNATRVRAALNATRVFRDATWEICLERRQLRIRWRGGRGGLNLMDASLADVLHAEMLLDRRRRKAARTGKPDPKPVSKVVSGTERARMAA